MIFNYFSIFIGFILFYYLFNKFPELSNEKQKRDLSLKQYSISIIIPARNEEINLPHIIEDLKKQNYKIHEIICVDDGSTDNTKNIIMKEKLKYIKISNLPKGWKGKTWACQTGAIQASGDLLLFIDADVRIAPIGLRNLVNHYENYGNPISIQPYHVVNKNHEYFSLFFNLIQICSTHLSVYKAKKQTGFYGPVLLISRNIFLENKGYNAVKNSVIEDYDLGKLYNRIDIPIDLLMGNKSFQFKMYPNSFSEVIEGWSKNFAAGAISINLKFFILIFFWIVYLSALPIEIARSFIYHNYILSLITIAVYFLTIIKIYYTSKKIGSYPLFISIIYPIYLLTFHLIFFYSFIGTYIIKSTKWKGRNMKDQ